MAAMNDTSPEALKVQLAAIRRLSPEARLRQGLELASLVRGLIATGVRARHPEYSEEEVDLATIRLVLGDELFRRVYPHATHIRP